MNNNLIKLNDTTLSARAKNCLKWKGIVYLNELENYTAYEISNFRNLGQVCLIDIQRVMNDYNLKFLSSSCGYIKKDIFERNTIELIDALIKNSHQVDILNAENKRLISYIESKIKEAGGK